MGGLRLSPAASGIPCRLQTADLRPPSQPCPHIGNADVTHSPPIQMGHSSLPYTDPWSVLGLPPNASRDEVKAAFRRAALATHPDVDPSPQAAARFADVKAAADVLLKGVSVCACIDCAVDGASWRHLPRMLSPRPALQAGGTSGAERCLPHRLPCSTSSRRQPGAQERQPVAAGGQHPQRGPTAPQRCGPRPVLPAAPRLDTAPSGPPMPSGGLPGKEHLSRGRWKRG